VKLRQYLSDSRTPRASAEVLHNPHADDVRKRNGEKHDADQKKIRVDKKPAGKEERRQNTVYAMDLFRIMTAVEDTHENE
jgi:hypothetical protein